MLPDRPSGSGPSADGNATPRRPGTVGEVFSCNRAAGPNLNSWCAMRSLLLRVAQLALAIVLDHCKAQVASALVVGIGLCRLHPAAPAGIEHVLGDAGNARGDEGEGRNEEQACMSNYISGLRCRMVISFAGNWKRPSRCRTGNLVAWEERRWRRAAQVWPWSAMSGAATEASAGECVDPVRGLEDLLRGLQ